MPFTARLVVTLGEILQCPQLQIVGVFQSNVELMDSRLLLGAVQSVVR